MEGFIMALWYLEQAVRLAQEAKMLAIQAQGFADLTEEMMFITKYGVKHENKTMPFQIT